MDKKTIAAIIVSSVVLVVLAVSIIAGTLYWMEKAKTQVLPGGGAAEDITNSATKGVLPSIQTNPLENKPDVNPAGKANPFKDIKINPFE